MTLSAGRLTRRRLNSQANDLIEVKVKNGYTLYIGGVVCWDTDGYGVPGASTNGLRVVGVAISAATGQQAPGQSIALASGGQTGTVVANVGVGEFALDISSASPVTDADLGKPVYLVDDHTIARVASGVRPFAGKLVGIEQYSPTGTQAWVALGEYVPTGTY